VERIQKHGIYFGISFELKHACPVSTC